ncbi:MAG: hypothetical protein IJF13_02915, partial [Clostridia bacterium]|nr:hypothetical protein [Clostridia bacterium]
SLVSEKRDGFNCTMPLKTEMAGLCKNISVEAEILRSVNSVRIEADGSFSGITTDGAGMVAAIREKGGEVTGRNVILLGAGGAARSIALSICREGVKKLTVLNRTISSLEPVVEMLRSCGCETEIVTGAISEADKYTADCHVLINATSCGMHGSAEFDSLDFVDSLPADAAVADAVYNPRETALIKKPQREDSLPFPVFICLSGRACLPMTSLPAEIAMGSIPFAYIMSLVNNRNSTPNATHSECCFNLCCILNQSLTIRPISSIGILTKPVLYGSASSARV